VIPQADIIAWRRVVPWADDGMVEQDLILSRALVEIFSDAAIAEALAFRGGTALHKVVLAPPSRYSEDLDLVQVEAGPIGAVLDRLRARLDPWLGEPTWERAASTVTLIYRFASEIPPVRRLRLKVEINTREHFTVYGHQTQRLSVESRWFAAYLRASHLRVTRAEFERNLAAKARNRLFIEEVTPMLAPGIAYDALAALDLVHREFIERLPGDAWKGGR
jgi:hypothetical protein